MAVLFASFLLATILVKVGTRHSQTPLRFRYRIQVCFSLLCLVSWVFVLVRSHGQAGQSLEKEVAGIVGFVVMAAIICHKLYRHRQDVADEIPRTVAPFKLPRLLWPLLVVLAPLVVLGLLAVWTLNSDRRSTREEARTRANEIGASVMSSAEDDLKIVEFSAGRFTVTKGQNIITVNHHFDLIQPRPWVWPPQPAPLTASDFSNLKSNKLSQWNDAERAFAAGEWKHAADLYLAFLDGHRQLGAEPRADFQARIANIRFLPIALSRRAAALEKSGDVPAAIAAYNDIFNGFILGPEAVSESGVGLAPLAVLKILDLAKDNPEALPEDWRRNPQFLVSELAQNGPVSPITEEAMRRLKQVMPALLASSPAPQTTNMLFDIWDRSMEGRQFYAEAQAQLGATNWPDVFWGSGSQPWLAVKQSPPPNWSAGPMEKPDETLYAIIRYDWLMQQLSNRWQELDPHRDFVIRVVIEGRMLLLSGAWSGTQFSEFLHGEASPKTGDRQQLQSASLPIHLIVQLQDPARYYQSVQRRQILFAALIVGALVAGLASALVLRRSLIRQQSLNEQKSNFVSSVSHELRAPIASVRLMAESLERGKVADGPKQNEYYRFIVQECRRLSSLIENVLDFSRIEQGRKQYEFEPTDIIALTRETVKLMEPYAEEKGVQLKLETSLAAPSPDRAGEGGNVEVEIDGRAVQQALVNLIDNAIKHSAKGQAVTIGLEAESGIGVSPVSNFEMAAPAEVSQNNYSEKGRMPVLLYVEDHGPGIPPAEQEKIFERFYRLGSELRRETQGVGIGLSIVRHIVEAHGGQVTVRSNIGEGSRFTIVLPQERLNE